MRRREAPFVFVSTERDDDIRGLAVPVGFLPRGALAVAPGMSCGPSCYRRTTSSKEANRRGDNFREGNRCDGQGGGNGRDEIDGSAEAAGSNKRRRCSDSRIGIRRD